jgi:hypothetical protein
MENKIVRISLASGLIGLLTTNPRKALEDTIKAQNDMGYSCTYFYPNNAPNLLLRVIQLVILICTLGLWTWGAGYLILLEKRS